MRSLTVFWNRALAALGGISMYRLVVMSLSAIAVVALIVSFFGLIAPTPLELVVAWMVVGASCAATDLVGHRILGRAWRWESTLATAAILVFILRPTLEPVGIAGLVLAGVVASASKYLLAWRGRHIFNPAAVGATVLTVVGVWVPGLGASAWWVGTPVLAAPVVVFGLLVLIRTEKLRLVTVFLVLAVGVAVLRTAAQYQSLGIEVDSVDLFWQILWSSPFLFLGAFMLSEPLTLPPRRWQQMTVAVVVGFFAGFPIFIGSVSLGAERALLIGNLVAFAFTLRAAQTLTVISRERLTPTVQQLTFRSPRLAFEPGQYVELEVEHRHPDARGTRRQFSIASAPADLPEVRIAFREDPSPDPATLSTFKRALAEREAGARLPVTGVWGDFLLPTRKEAPVLMVAAGIGVTPFVSQLRELALSGQHRDIVLVYVASSTEELAYRADLEAAGIPVIVFTRDRPEDLPENWRWAGGVRLDAAGLLSVVPDIKQRHAYVSGPAGLIADLTPAFEYARSLTTDAFSGY